MRIFEIDGYKYMAYGRPFKRERKKKQREAWESLENQAKGRKLNENLVNLWEINLLNTKLREIEWGKWEEVYLRER